MSTFFSASGGSPPASPSRFPGLFPGQVSALAPDFLLSNHGSIVLLEPQSDSAVAWIDDNRDQDHMLFGAAVVIEPRYMSDIIAGIQRDGLVLR